MPGSRCCLAVCPFTTVPRRQLELVLVDISSLRHVVRSPFAVTSREWAVGRRWVLEPCSGAGLGGSWGSPFRWSISGGMSRCCPRARRFAVPAVSDTRAAHARSEAQLARPTSSVSRARARANAPPCLRAHPPPEGDPQHLLRPQDRACIPATKSD